jgi:hypothetical protein
LVVLRNSAVQGLAVKNQKAGAVVKIVVRKQCVSASLALALAVRKQKSGAVLGLVVREQ